MSYDLTGATVSSTYGRIVQVVLGNPNTYYDGFGNLLDIGSPIGATGPTGPSGISFNWTGDWDEMMLYFSNDVVSYNGSSYICTVDISGTPPFQSPENNISWDILAEGKYAPFYFQSDRPIVDPTVLGSRWLDSDTGKEYVWVFDGYNYNWMQPTQITTIKNRTNEISTATYSVNFNFDYYGVIYTNGICTINLPIGISPDDDGKMITISDEVGGISKYNRGINVLGTASQLINGYDDIIMKIDRMSLTFTFRNSSWKTI